MRSAPLVPRAKADLDERLRTAAEAQIINAAFGLVQGAFGDGHLASARGDVEWSKPKVEAAARRAAETFLRELSQQK